MKQNLCTKLVKLMVGLALATCLPAMLPAQSLRWLGVLPGGSSSGARGVSADGTVVIGRGTNEMGITRAFRWSPLVGMQDMGALPGFSASWANSVSPDGSIMVGWCRSSSNDVATSWRPVIPQSLGVLSGSDSWATGVSLEGSVTVGVAIGGDGRRRAVRWVNLRDIQDLGTLGGNLSEANAVSYDGTTVVGFARQADGFDVAFRWTQSSGMESLGTLEGGTNSRAMDVSADGSVIVGWSRFRIQNFVPYRAFRWTQETGMENLGELSPYDISVVANGVSADGSIVVGGALEQRDSQYLYRAFRWQVSTGIQNLNQVYAHLLAGGSSLTYAYDISTDGRYIVGDGYNRFNNRTEAFLLDTWRTADTNGDGCIDDQDLLAVLFAFGTAGSGLTRHEDMNKDGVVDDADLLLVLFHFGNGCQ